MQLLPLEAVPPGAILGRSLYLDERTLLKHGVPLTEQLLRRLAELGFETVYIRDPDEPETEPVAELLSEQTRRRAYTAVNAYVKRLDRGYAGDLRPVAAIVSRILDEVLANGMVVLQLGVIRALRDEQEYLFHHSVRVCATAILLGIHSGLDQRELQVLGMGAILHDVGKVRVPRPILTKEGSLTPEERATMEQHTTHGFEILRHHRELDIRTAHVAYQHHERWDGSGYPRGLSGEGIHRFARITAVADVFDALTSQRPYRAAWPVHEAVAFIEEGAGQSFDPDAVRTFLARVAPYPVGTLIRLNTGQTALVVRLNPKTPARPVVRVWNGSVHEDELDLSVNLERRIVGPALWNASEEEVSTRASTEPGP